MPWGWAQGVGFTPLVPHSLYALRRTSHVVDRLSNRGEEAHDESAAALGAVRDRLADQSGPDPESWAWGDVRPLTLHQPLDLGSFPVGGDANTVAQCSPSPAEPVGGPTVAIASLRIAIDVGDWDNSRYVLPRGQLESPFSSTTTINCRCGEGRGHHGPVQRGGSRRRHRGDHGAGSRVR